MKTKTIGIIILITGIVLIIYSKFNFSPVSNIADTVRINKMDDRAYPIQWPPVIGIVLVIGGIVINTYDKRKINETG